MVPVFANAETIIGNVGVGRSCHVCQMVASLKKVERTRERGTCFGWKELEENECVCVFAAPEHE